MSQTDYVTDTRGHRWDRQTMWQTAEDTRWDRQTMWQTAEDIDETDRLCDRCTRRQMRQTDYVTDTRGDRWDRQTYVTDMRRQMRQTDYETETQEETDGQTDYVTDARGDRWDRQTMWQTKEETDESDRLCDRHTRRQMETDRLCDRHRRRQMSQTDYVTDTRRRQMSQTDYVTDSWGHRWVRQTMWQTAEDTDETDRLCDRHMRRQMRQTDYVTDTWGDRWTDRLCDRHMRRQMDRQTMWQTHEETDETDRLYVTDTRGDRKKWDKKMNAKRMTNRWLFDLSWLDIFDTNFLTRFKCRLVRRRLRRIMW